MKHRPLRHGSAYALACLFQIVWLEGCLYDKNNRCGPNLVLSADRLSCRCPDATLPGPDGTCPSLTIGAPCETSSECPGDLAHCKLPEGYCTKLGCAESEECGSGFACVPGALGEGGASNPSSSEVTFCQRPPRGLGQTCESAADCAGTEATWCDIFMTCSVIGCDLAADDCFPGYECCDVSSFGVPEPLCVQAGSCQ